MIVSEYEKKKIIHKIILIVPLNAFFPKTFRHVFSHFHKMLLKSPRRHAFLAILNFIVQLSPELATIKYDERKERFQIILLRNPIAPECRATISFGRDDPWTRARCVFATDITWLYIRSSESYAISLMTYMRAKEEILRVAHATQRERRYTSVIVHMRRDGDSKCPPRPLLAKLRHSRRRKPRNFVDQHSAAHASTRAVSPMSSRIFTRTIWLAEIQLAPGVMLKIQLGHHIFSQTFKIRQQKPKRNFSITINPNL